MRYPSLWAEANLCDPDNPEKPLVLRWFQRILLDTQVKKKASRIGRRSGKSAAMAVDMLWYAYTHAYSRTLVVFPREDQVTETFNMLDRLIMYSPSISGSITRKNKKPALIQWSNGSSISGITLGAKTGESGLASRGKGPNRLYIDEMDWMTHDAIVAVRALLIKEDMSIWASSTPSGKREDFYQICTNKELGYQEFHWSTPEALGDAYTDAMDYEFRTAYTDIEYDQEILANFSEAMAGVFRNEDINASVKNYEMDRLEPNPKNRYMLGVDWNQVDRVGTRYTIVEQMIDKDAHKENTGLFRLFRAGFIGAKEYTQQAGVNKVVELYLWLSSLVPQPNFHIYVDYGGGATNIELLRKWADERQDAKFIRCFHSVDFGSKLTMYDPVTHKEVNKPAKPFIVNCALKILEDRKSIFPKEVDNEQGLCGQMRKYRVTSRSIAGEPVYTKKDDHDLTAYMLSCYGFFDQYSDILNYKTKSLPRKPERVPSPIRNLFQSIRQIEVSKSRGFRKMEPGETTTGPQFAEAAQSAGFGYVFAGTNKDYEDVMSALDSIEKRIGTKNTGIINRNVGIHRSSSIVTINRPGPRGTNIGRRIQRGYRTSGF